MTNDEKENHDEEKMKVRSTINWMKRTCWKLIGDISTITSASAIIRAVTQTPLCKYLLLTFLSPSSSPPGYDV